MATPLASTITVSRTLLVDEQLERLDQVDAELAADAAGGDLVDFETVVAHHLLVHADLADLVDDERRPTAPRGELPRQREDECRLS